NLLQQPAQCIVLIRGGVAQVHLYIHAAYPVAAPILLGGIHLCDDQLNKAVVLLGCDFICAPTAWIAA
ncbi:MAG: hypothetical protein AB7V55_02665, partial [Oscillospiraceae bacterium]